MTLTSLPAAERSALIQRIRLAEELQRRGLWQPPARAALEADWRDWITTLFPRMATAPFAAHHERFWAWVWAQRLGEPSDALVAILPRGGGKSSSAETATIAVGARGTRRYGLYVSATQEQADKHVSDIGAKLELSTVEQYYPTMASRAVGKYGASRGWRRNRFTTASGFVVDALGLDAAARGIKFEDQRPDWIVLDDIDARHDSEAIVQKKIETLTESILPAGAQGYAAVLAVQNLIHADSIFARLADGRADFLRYRQVIGPYPAAHDLAVDLDPSTDPARYVVTAGTPTWAGQNIATIEYQINQWGLGPFLREAQHEVNRDPEDALWRREWINAHRVGEAPPLARVVVGVDPSGSRRGDEVGIIAAGIDYRRHGYVLDDRSCHASPDDWGTAAVQAFVDFLADCIVAEANFGGEMVESVIQTAARKLGVRVVVKLVHASRGKAVRAEPAAAVYQQGLMHHVGTHLALENQLCGWRPLDPVSPGKLDATVWAVEELGIGAQGVPTTPVAAAPRAIVSDARTRYQRYT